MTSHNRRYDLDALRAVAMLLGIVLHGALSFIPGVGMFWGVQDIASRPWFGVLNSSIHGWRMPLFFFGERFLHCHAVEEARYLGLAEASIAKDSVASGDWHVHHRPSDLGGEHLREFKLA